MSNILARYLHTLGVSTDPHPLEGESGREYLADDTGDGSRLSVYKLGISNGII